MYRTSERFMNYISESKIRKPKSKIVLDGEEYTGATHLKSFPKIEHSTEKLCGVFPMKTVEFEIYDIDKSLNFHGKEFSVFRGLDIDGDTEWVPMGVFRAENENIKTNVTAGTINCKAYDRAHQFDVQFNSTPHTFPCTIGTFVNQICDNHNIELETVDFPFGYLSLNELPKFSEKITEREIISLIAELSGSVAQISRLGGLRISGPQDTDAEIVSGTYKSFSSEKKTAITSVCISNDGAEDVIYTDTDLVGEYGEFVHHIKDNPFTVGRQEELIEDIASYVIGINVTPFSLTDYIDDFIYDLNDRIVIKDRSGIETETTILSLSTQSRIKSNFSAPTQKTEQESYLSGSVEQIVADSEKRTNDYADALNDAQKSLIENMNNALGVFTTVISASDGSSVMYCHDKEELATSTYIFTFNSNGFAWAKGSGCWNGGEPQWQYGVDADGGGILETLLVRKITADIIEAGTIKSIDKRTRFDLDKGEISTLKEEKDKNDSVFNTETIKLKSGRIIFEKNYLLDGGYTVSASFGADGIRIEADDNRTTGTFYKENLGMVLFFYETQRQTRLNRNGFQIQNYDNTHKAILNENKIYFENGTEYSNEKIILPETGDVWFGESWSLKMGLSEIFSHFDYIIVPASQSISVTVKNQTSGVVMVTNTATESVFGSWQIYSNNANVMLYEVKRSSDISCSVSGKTIIFTNSNTTTNRYLTFNLSYGGIEE